MEIEIEKPTRVLSKRLDPRLEEEGAPGGGAADLLGDALSEDCRSWWNDTIRAIETGIPRPHGGAHRATGAASGGDESLQSTRYRDPSQNGTRQAGRLRDSR